MPKIELTQSLIDTPPTCTKGRSRIDYYDTLIKGLVLEVRASGTKTYHLRYRDTSGRQCQAKLGDASTTTLVVARGLATKERTRLSGSKSGTADMTFRTFAEDLYMPHALVRKRSWKTDRALLDGRILLAWGERRLSDLTRADIATLHDGMRTSGLAPATCNRLLSLVSFMLTLAVRWGHIPHNPAAGVEKFEENNQRNRYLSEEETGRLLTALDSDSNQTVASAVKLLLLTGARRGEVLGACWADFDLERRDWKIPLSKSGRARHVPLSEGAVTLLRSLKRGGDQEPVFPTQAGKRFLTIFPVWKRIRANAGLGNFRLHDLRHSYASFLVSNQRSLYEVQALLGHADAKTTMRYAHLSPQALFQATGMVDAMISRVAAGNRVDPR